MEESVAPTVTEGEITGIQFVLASHHEIRTSSISDCPISHASQLANPFLGLPLETGKCESCGTAEPGKCEGHFGYIELPIPIYHPSHISELRRMLSLICLKCLKMKSNKFPVKNNGVMERLLSACCEEACHISIKENKNSDGALFLELRIPGRSRVQEGAWNFLERYGYRYGNGSSRTLLPSEVSVMLKKLPEDTRRKLSKKGYFLQEGYIVRYLPVPPNCLSVPDVSDGVSVMSSDLCSAMLKKVLRQIEIIRSSRSGEPNFESHEVEANDLQIAVSQYLQVRGTGKAARDADNRYGVSKEGSNTSTKAWLEKMRTLFISKGSGFSSRTVITGDAYKPVNEVGVPSEIAQKMTFEERVNIHNIQYLQSLVDNNLCLTFRDGLSTYSLREGSKGHTFLRIGQVVHRRIMDGDIVFINRPPTTHKHSLQALRVYIHDDHVVKINPLMCGPLAADFDGDCVHLFYPQSLSARAEVLELFSVEKQLLSSHSGNLNLQLATDSLLSLKTMFKVYFLDKASAQQLAMHASTLLPSPALLKACSAGPLWTAQQVLQTALPPEFECQGDRLLIRRGEVVKLDVNRDVMASVISDILTSLFFNKSPKEALNFFDSLQPLLMENLFAEGFSVGLHDFFIPMSELQSIQSQIQDISPLLFQLRSSFNELVQLQFDKHIRLLKLPVADFILKSSTLGNVIDSRSDSAIDKVVQQIGFLGLQLSDKRKFYSRSLVEEVASLFHQKYPFGNLYPSEEFGLVKSCFFHGLDPYEEIVHSIATREVIVRSSKGLAEPGTLFKNLMAILRDVVVCYDGSVRNISSNSIIQFEYGVGGVPSQSLFPAGEPVGVLAATAMSNPAYKAVLDSSPSSNSSWDMMKEILFCHVNFKNNINDRRVILYLNDCGCGRKYCQENASYLVKNHLKKVSLRDAAIEFSIEYKRSKLEPGTSEIDTGLVGHIHLNVALLKESRIGMHDILQKCEEQINLLRKKRKYGAHFRSLLLSVSECCFFQHSGSRPIDMPCLKFFWQDLADSHLEKKIHIMADMICPVLLDTVIKGDPRISTVNIIWISPGTITWVQSPGSSENGELAVEVNLEKTAVRQSGDAWRVILDCCLPVFHLIDTRRSIPYAIKQIQELLGISCAFDQAVQRLSTSVTMVTKGVLKDHLLLLASSMTCAGNLVGFNMSGIKALCRALSVQVPFTEATLYTPRKCFERASEKCHVDTLASIVASCSWGKRVAVGTGAKFDILWDTKEIEMADKPIDVYNFLHLVRSSVDEEIDTGGLGEDIDQFDWMDSYDEPALSPEQENKAVFEDAVEVGLHSEVPGAGGSSWDAFPSSGTGWNANKSDAGSGSAEGSGWSSWGAKKNQSQPEDSGRAGDWDASKSWGGSNPKEPSGWAKNDSQRDLGSGLAEGNGWSNWGPKKVQSQPEDSSKGGGWDASNSWGKPSKETDNTGWKKNDPRQDLEKFEGSGGWDNKVQKETKASSSSGWGQPESGRQENTHAWSKEVNKKKAGSNEDVQQQSSWGAADGKWNQKTWNSGLKEEQNQPSNSQGWDSAGKNTAAKSQWGQPANEGENKGNSNGEDLQMEEGKTQPWDIASSGGAKKASWGQPSGTPWKKSGHESSGGWASDKANEQAVPGSWGSSQKGAGSWSSGKGNQRASSQSWDAEKEHNKTQPSWGPSRDSSWKKDRDERVDGWSSPKFNQQGGSRTWENKRKESNTQSSWAQQGDSTGKNHHETGLQSWEARKEEKAAQPSWGEPKNSNESTGGWSSDKASGEDGSRSWESRKKEDKPHSSWGKPKNSCGSAGGWNSTNAIVEGGSGSWGSQKEDNQTQSSWGKPKNSGGSAGGWSSTNAVTEVGSGSWESQKEDNQTQSSWGKPKNSSGSAGGWSSTNATVEGGSRSWGSQKEDKQTQSSWGKPKNSGGSAGGWSSTNAIIEGGSGSWESQKEDSQTPSSWGQPKNSGGAWGPDKACEDGGSGSWESQKEKNKTQPPWGQPINRSWEPHKEENKASEEGGSNNWESKKEERKTQSTWGKPSDSTSNNTQSADEWGTDKSNDKQDAWGSGNTGKESEKQGAWGQANVSTWKTDANENSCGSDGWGSPKGNAGNESESQSPWGQPGGSGWRKKRPEGGRGWGSSNSGEWKNRKNRPPKQLGASNDDSTSVAFTATRKRMDLFTAEEQDALSEVESIMQSIRRIMHQSGFNDGDPLPPDDQSYIIDNVLSHHPDKAAKIGAGVDYITVKKHSNFQESRCFYVVSTDGHTEDFSYIKCLENLMKGKYSAVAESFNSKYFRRSRPSGNDNKSN